MFIGPARAGDFTVPAGPDATHRPLHLERSTAGAPLVLDPLEEEQHCIAAPLDHPSAEVVGARQELGKARVEDLVHLLGSDLPPA